MEDLSNAQRATVLGSMRKRPFVVGLSVVLGLAAGVLVSTRGDATYTATAMFVVETPTVESTSGQSISVSPDRFVNDQVAAFDLQTLLRSTAEIANRDLGAERRKSLTGSIVVGSEAPVVLGRDTSVKLNADGSSLTVDVDGGLRAASQNTPSLGPDGIILNSASTPILDLDGTPLEVGTADTLVVRDDGVMVLVRAASSPVVIAPPGRVVDLSALPGEEQGGVPSIPVVGPPTTGAAVERTDLTGVARTSAGTLLVGFGERSVRIEASSKPVITALDGSPLDLPGREDFVGIAQSLLLLRSDGAAVARSSSETVVVGASQDVVVVIGSDGQVVDQTAGAVVNGAGAMASPFEPLDAQAVRTGLAVSSRTDTNLVEVRFTAPAPDVARVVANAAIEAYESLRTDNSGSERSAAQRRATSAISAVSAELADVERQITTQRFSNSDRQALDGQYLQLLGELAVSGQRLIDDPVTGSLQAQRVRDLITQIDAIERIAAIELQQPGFADLVARRDQLRSRVAQLQTQLDALEIDPRSSGSPVALTSPAVAADPTAGLGASRLGFVGLMLGLFSGAGAAYLLDSRRSSVSSVEEVAAITRAPLLGEVPDFKHERIKSQIPVVNNPATFAAEALRMAAVTLSIGLAADGGSIIGVVSAGVGDGKTTTAVNLAAALAHAERRVLVVDADLEGQVSSLLLRPHVTHVPEWRGLIDIVQHGIELGDAVQNVTLADGTQLDLLSAGSGALRLRSLLDLPEVHETFSAAAAGYDVVVVDLPPLLNVAYAAQVLREVDGAALVVTAATSAGLLTELRNRLDLFRVPVLGFVYNRQPLRPERTASISALHYDLAGHRSSRSGWRRRRLQSVGSADNRRGTAASKRSGRE